ncbi:MAG: sigma-54 dependent transcriptional regulator [Bdellovibrionota bacterium]
MKELRPRILVVDDDEQIADILTLRLESEGYRVDTCSSVGPALEKLACNQYSLILLDLRLQGENGVESLPRFRDIDSEVPIFIITAHGDVDSAVQAFSMGANGYIRKPFQEGALRLQISQAIESYHMKLEVARLRRLIQEGETEVSKDELLDQLILTRDPTMQRFLEQVRIASSISSNVVVYGGSGTGKELVARALHQMGPRAKGPFVAINCGAFPETLLESELFGFVKGAFTDARESKIGHIVRANGGTLFLDEIGDAPLSIQVRLLRVIQEREVLPLGAGQPVKVDVRIIAATHRDLRQLVAEKKFRDDLFYRLQVLPLHVPALRERKQDVAYLATVFATRFASQHGRKFEGFTAAALVAMQAYEWPGNVRELQNRVEHAVVMGKSPVLTTADLFPEGAMAVDPMAESQSSSAKAIAEAVQADEDSSERPESLGEMLMGTNVPPYKEAKENFERQYVESLLRHARGNIARAARIAGKYRTEVYGLIRKYSLDPRAFKGDSNELK